jgi:hypothetical protein
VGFALFGPTGAGDQGQYEFASAELLVMEETMSHFSRCALIIGAPLAIIALLACVTPAGARLAANRLAANKLASNAIAQNGVPANARITTGSALGDLNGVAVEAVIIPGAANH